nr:hypothetical protein [Robertkochia marina]
MKSGAFNLVAERYGLKKLHPNTHLYTGDKLVDFPGRRFRVKIAEDYNKKSVKKLLAGKKANLTTRNFPDTVSSLRKKFRISDGGDTYAFFCSGPEDRKLLIVTEKI